MEFERRFVEANTPIEAESGSFHRAGGIDLSTIRDIFRRSTRELAGITAIGVGLMGLFLIFAAPKIYTASGSIVLDSRQPKLFNIDGMLASADVNQDNIDTQIALLRSTRIAERVLDIMEERGIVLPTIDKPDVVASAEHAGGSAHSGAKMRDPSLIEALQRRLRIERKGRSLLVDVMYSDTDPGRAAVIANAFMDGYISDQLRSRSAATQSNSKVLKERVDDIRKELVAAEQQIQTYKADNDIVELGTMTLAQQEVANHEQELAKVRAAAAQADARVGQVGSMANELARDAAKGQVKILEAGLDALKQKVQKSSEQMLKLDELRRDSDALKATYGALLKRYQESQAQEGAVSSDAQIVNYAAAPTYPSFPRRKLMLFLALVGSMILGAIGILIRELLRGRIYSGADVERMLGLQPLAKIPLFSDVSPFPVVEKDALYFDKNGTFEQAAFSVRRWAEAISAPRNTIVAVVSEAAGDGRSTVAAALAFGAARAGRKTLLVDADFRDRALTRTLAADTESGLAQAGSGDVPAVVSRLGERLPDFCGAVLSGTETPLGVLDSPAIAEFLANARETYDLTVVDTAAFGPYVDASAIVDLADGVLVVLRSGVTTQVTADNIMKEIAAVGAKPVGVVLNMVPRSGINRLRDVVPEAWVRMFSEKFDALKSRIRAAA